MNIQIFGKSKCFDTKKAERYFKERRIRVQHIDLLRYGLSGRREMTQKEIADKMGISQSYISRLEKKIIQRLKKEITKMV